MIHLTVMIPEKIYERIKALRKHIVTRLDNTVSRAAVLRLLIYMGLKAVEETGVETAVEMAREEGIL